jgi:hypothetical protein
MSGLAAPVDARSSDWRGGLLPSYPTCTAFRNADSALLDSSPLECYIFAVVYGESLINADSKEVRQTSAELFERTRHSGR